MVLQGLEYRKVTLAREIEEWGQEDPDVPLDMARGTALHLEMARIDDQLELMVSPSAPVEPDEAVNAGSPLPAHDRGVSSKSAWKGEQADSKGVTGVCLENEHKIEPISERNPVEEMKKEMMREELNNFPSSLRGGKRSRSQSEKYRSLSTHSPRKINRTRLTLLSEIISKGK